MRAGQLRELLQDIPEEREVNFRVIAPDGESEFNVVMDHMNTDHMYALPGGDLRSAVVITLQQ